MYKIIGADGREYGQVSADQLRSWIAESRANAQTKVLPEGGTEWKSLSELPEFDAALAGVASAAPATISLGPSPVQRNNSMAIAGLVMGILSVTCCLMCVGLPCNILGIIFSAIGLSQIQKNPAAYKGKGMAIAGLVLCILSFFLWLTLYLAVPHSLIMQKLQEIQRQQQ